MTFRVLVADRIAESGFNVLRGAPNLEIVSTAQNRDRLPEEIARAHGLIVRSDTRVTEDLIAQANELIVIGRAGVGVDNVDVAAATRRGIAVLNAPAANTVSAAEHTIGLLLAGVRKIPWAAASMRGGRWERTEFPGTELRGKTLGIVGLGRIGSHVANLARAFGMKVVAHDPYPEGQHRIQAYEPLVGIPIGAEHPKLNEPGRPRLAPERMKESLGWPAHHVTQPPSRRARRRRALRGTVEHVRHRPRR